MKKLYFIPLLLMGAMTLSSCDDFLEEEVRGQENLDTYFQGENDVESFIHGCYNAITNYDWWQVERVWILSDMCTDDYWMGNTQQNQEEYISLAHYQGVGQSNGSISDFWQYRYKGILRCNIALDRIPDVQMDETRKARYIAEAKFLRAYFYFELVKNFGGVPLVEGFVMPHEVSGIRRSSVEDCYAFIAKDLEEAAAALPTRSQLAADEIGRATSGAALGLLGKVQVYNGEFDKAKVTLKKVIDSGQYALMDDFGKVWNMDYENNQESLFEVQNIYDETYRLGGSMAIVSGNRGGGDMDGWGWGVPTAYLENCFIEAGDYERLKWTIIKNGATEIPGENNFDELIQMQGNQNGDGSYYVSPEINKSARVSRKHYLPVAHRPGNFNTALVPLNYIILRYADILLLYAEACNETGDDGNARAALNQVRKRVHLPEVNTSGTALRKDIRTERHLELATEAQRLYDIRRWTDDNGKKVVCNLMGPDGAFVKWNTNAATADAYEWANQKEASDKGRTFQEGRDLVFPIPLYEITMSQGAIEQNPGWN